MYKYSIIFIILFFFITILPQTESQQQGDPDGTQLILDPPASSVIDGRQITFTGRYIDQNGAGISGLEIKIRDWDGDCLLCTSDTLATGNTDASGYFSITWNAWCEDNEDPCNMEIFAERVQGDGDVVRTSYYSVAIVQTISTSLTLDQPTSTVTEGDTVTFTGRLTRDDTGAGIAGHTIYIYDFDTGDLDGIGDDLLDVVFTDSNGYYSISWVAICTDSHQTPCEIEIYAYFAGTSEFDSTQSNWYYVEVLFAQPIVTPTITIDKSTYYRGEIMQISGTANPNEQLLVTLDHATEGNTGIKDVPVDVDSDGFYIFEILFEESDPIGIYTLTVQSDVCSCSTAVTLELLANQQIVTPTITIDKSTYYRGEIMQISGTANPNEQLLVTLDHATEGNTGIKDVPVDVDSDGFYIFEILFEESDPIGIYTLTVQSDVCSCSTAVTLELLATLTIDTTLIMDPLVAGEQNFTVTEGDVVTFTGRLTRDDTGAGIPNALITLYDWDGGSLLDGVGEFLSSAYTDSNGYFTITWTATCMDIVNEEANPEPGTECQAETYSHFAGDSTYERSRSPGGYRTNVIEAVTIIDTTLTFDEPPSLVNEGDTVTFTGRLTRTDTGAGISGQTIYIYDYDRGGWDGSGDDILGIGTTDSNGYFSLNWVAEDRDVNDDVMETYAYFHGTNEFIETSSEYYYPIEVLQSINTILTLDIPPLSVNEGDTVTFTGRLTRDDTGAGISGQTIYLYDADIGILNGVGDDLLGTGTTDSNGYFSINWVAEDVDFLDDLIDIYVYFEGTEEFSSSASDWYLVEVVKSILSTSLQFDEPPSLVDEGDTVTFTGRLTRTDTGAGISGQTIYIYDYDGGDDDLLASGTTDSNGYFSIDWIAEDRDINDDVMEVYAYYFGTDEFEPSVMDSYYTVEVILSTKKTTITLDDIPVSVVKGTQLVLSGQLIEDVTGEGISNQIVYIMEYDNPGIFDDDDTILFSGYTDQNGYFSFTWDVICIDNDENPCTIELYTYYPGNDEFASSWPANYKTLIVTNTIETILTFDKPPSLVNEGDTVTFTGRLTRTDTGAGISGQTIYIYDYDRGGWDGSGDDILGIGTTDSNGYFSLNWVAEDRDVNDDVMETYAYFSGTNDFTTSVSKYYYQIEVTLSDNSAPEVSVNHSPLEPTNMDSITFTIFVDDDSGNDGFREVRLIVDGDIVETWNTLGTHEITLGPFPEGEHNYFVIAEDVSDNWGSDPVQGAKTFFVQNESNKIQSILSLHIPVSIADEGDSIQFSGNLIDVNGNPIEDVLILISDYDGEDRDDDLLASGFTDVNGNFEINWHAICTDINRDPCIVEVYAEFSGSTIYSKSIFPEDFPNQFVSLEINTVTIPIQGFAICQGVYCEEHDQTIPNALVWLFWDDGYCSDNPTIDCLNYLFENGNVFELQYYKNTFTDKSGEFIFYDVPITSSSGSPNTFYVVVQLMHESYIDVIDLRESESGITYSKWVGPIFFSSDDSEFIVPVRFTTNDEMSAAAYYTYYVRIFDYIISELGQPEIDNYPHLQVKIFSDIGCVERKDCGSPHFQPFSPTSSDCFDTSRKDNRGRANYCYVQIPYYALPSANQNSWKDAAAMELIHALHWANGGLRDDGITLMNRWWAENWGTFMAEALQHELGDNKGAQNRNIGYFGTCGGNIEHLTYDSSRGKSYTRYYDPIDNGKWWEDSWAVYCPAASIIWDFFDHSSIPDTRSGNNEDENISISLKTLWQLSFEDIYSLLDLYNYLKDLDINLDGTVNSLDVNLTEEIFSLHGASGGRSQG